MVGWMVGSYGGTNERRKERKIVEDMCMCICMAWTVGLLNAWMDGWIGKSILEKGAREGWREVDR